jgi:hypothetical protein
MTHKMLSSTFCVHPGFTVYAGPPVDAAQIASLVSQARYITRPAVDMDSLQKPDDGSLVMDTPPDPRSGATSITLDPPEWIHRSFITDSRAVDRILRHPGSGRSKAQDPFEPGAPPGVAADSPQ